MKLKANTKYEWSQDNEKISGKFISFTSFVFTEVVWATSVYFILVYFTYMAMEWNVMYCLP